MQADEIIQQKEWHELSPAEMQTVQELAENEQEYNLLKKMMQVSGEEASEAPMISNSVKENLTEMVREQRPSSKRYWYLAAAAAVAALIFAGILIFPKKTVNDGIAVNDPKPNDTVAIVKKEFVKAPEKIDTATAWDSAKNIAEQKKHLKPIQLNVPAEDFPSSDKANTSYAAADVHVSDNAALLNLVTEIY